MRRQRKQPRRCMDCRKRIDFRGRAAKRCEKCAKVHLTRWRKKYDAIPGNVDKRRSYDSKRVNVSKSRRYRNKKIYLLDLCFQLLRLENLTIDEAIPLVESKLKARGRGIPEAKKGRNGVALSHHELPWSTMRGRYKRKPGQRVGRIGYRGRQ